MMDIFIITNTMHTIGVDKITLFKTTKNNVFSPTCFDPHSSMYIQEYHRKGHLITEQQIPEHNLIFDLINTTVPNKETSEVVAEGRHKPSETNIT